jgi:hypothetical protein
MIPSTEHVMKKRHHNRRRLRFLSLCLIVVGLVFTGWGFFSAALNDEWYSWQGYAALGFALWVPAVVLWPLDGFLARALVPLPDNRCPRCRYELIALQRPTCPECGLPVPAVFVRPPPS